MAKRTSYGATWWGQRWIAALERLGWASRLQRGRSYARSGHVRTLEVKPGKVTARVAGSRPQPYRVTILLKPLSDAEWDRVVDTLAGRAAFAASLLAGEMPRDIGEAFAAVGVPLFPQTEGDLETTCTCPDWANPCKHVAAAYFRLGEEFDKDPFVLLHLRGREREALLAALRQRRASAAAGPSVGLLGLNQFWQPGDRAMSMAFRMEPPATPGAVLRRLGPIPGVDVSVMERLGEFYEVFGREALALALEEPGEDEDAGADGGTER